ncbi:MAG: rod shape-determining protein RodA [Paludibacteraceae bacterium]|nr:rod shape-determining protein RodA [Paludibacteraceae bacterium]
MASEFNAIKHIDKPLLIIYLLLVIVGWFNIYSASVTESQTSFYELSSNSGKQLLWISVSLVVALIIFTIKNNVFSQLAYVSYWPMMVLLAITLPLAMLGGGDTKGSYSWISFGSFKIQPAEFAKYFVTLAIAKCMSEYTFQLKGLKNYLRVVFLFLLPMGLIIMEKETGTALVYLSFILLMYREGMPGLVPLLAFLAVVLSVLVLRFSSVMFCAMEGAPVGLVVALLIVFIVELLFILHYYYNWWSVLYIVSAFVLTIIAFVVFRVVLGFDVNLTYFLAGLNIASGIYLVVMSFLRWRVGYLWIAVFVIVSTVATFSVGYAFDNVLEPHQQNRIMVALGMIDDPHGVGYNTIQSKIAIGSGGLLGKGFMNGTQTRLKYVPEQHTDFIFCTVAEEWGFVGALVLIGLYFGLMYRILVIAERQEYKFSRCYAYGVLGIILFHFIINVGMVIGLMPVIGIPLPLVSYGGSGMLGFTLLLATLLKLDTQREERLF